MGFQAIPALASAINAIRGSATVARFIRIGDRVVKVLDATSPQQKLVPYIDKAALQNSIKQIQRNYAALGESPNKTLVKHMRTHYANLAGNLAEITPPFANGRSVLEKKIERDINAIFRPLEEVPFGNLIMAKNFSAAAQYNIELDNKNLANAVESNNWAVVYGSFERHGWKEEGASGIVAVSKPTKSLHYSAITKSGKVKNQFHVVGSKSKAQEQIKNYADDVKKTIGKMAGGWVKCYVGLGGSGKRLSLSDATKGEGSYSIVGGKNGYVSIRNNYANFNGYLSKRRTYVLSELSATNGHVLRGITVDLQKQMKQLRLS